MPIYLIVYTYFWIKYVFLYFWLIYTDVSLGLLVYILKNEYHVWSQKTTILNLILFKN